MHLHSTPASLMAGIGAAGSGYGQGNLNLRSASLKPLCDSVHTSGLTHFLGSAWVTFSLKDLETRRRCCCAHCRSTLAGLPYIDFWRRAMRIWVGSTTRERLCSA